MFLKIEPFGLILFCFVAANCIGILAFALFLRHRARRKKRLVTAISAAIFDYFRNSGVKVAVGCVSLQENSRYTAFIESEPMKRFRLSHIIEMTVREHVLKTCGVKLERIFWRFPIKESVQDGSGSERFAQDRKAAGESDPYINEGLMHYKDLPKVDVSEIPWEQFTEITIQDAEKNIDAKSEATNGKTDSPQ